MAPLLPIFEDYSLLQQKATQLVPEGQTLSDKPRDKRTPRTVWAGR